MKPRVLNEKHKSPRLWAWLVVLALLTYWPAGAGARVRCPDPEVPDEANVMICVRVIKADVHRKMDLDPDLIVYSWENGADCSVTGSSTHPAPSAGLMCGGLFGGCGRMVKVTSAPYAVPCGPTALAL